MDETIRQAMLTQCEEIDRQDAAYLAEHPTSPRYCYTCQQWLDNEDAEVVHIINFTYGHSIH